MLIQTGTKELRNVAFICVVEIEKEIVFSKIHHLVCCNLQQKRNSVWALTK